jgi:5-methylcytosine-specific restriction endonuclease McrA
VTGDSRLKRTGRIRGKRSSPRRRDAPRVASHAEWDGFTMLLWARSRGVCEKCGENPPTDRHHRKRRRDGGDRLANLLFLCSTCHHWLHDNAESETHARDNGYIVPALGVFDLLTYPVLQWGTTWVVLDDDGHAVACDAPN